MSKTKTAGAAPPVNARRRRRRLSIDRPRKCQPVDLSLFAPPANRRFRREESCSGTRKGVPPSRSTRFEARKITAGPEKRNPFSGAAEAPCPELRIPARPSWLPRERRMYGGGGRGSRGFGSGAARLGSRRFAPGRAPLARVDGACAPGRSCQRRETAFSDPPRSGSTRARSALDPRAAGELDPGGVSRPRYTPSDLPVPPPPRRSCSSPGRRSRRCRTAGRRAPPAGDGCAGRSCARAAGRRSRSGWRR